MALSSASPGSNGELESSPRLSRPTLKYMAKRVLAEFSRDGGTDQAAKLTYFMVLSIAPTLLAVFSLATLLLSGIKEQISQLLVDAINSAVGSSGMGADTAVKSTVDSLMGSASGGTIALIIGIATALWSASAYVKAFGRVANDIYEVPEGRAGDAHEQRPQDADRLAPLERPGHAEGGDQHGHDPDHLGADERADRSGGRPAPDRGGGAGDDQSRQHDERLVTERAQPSGPPGAPEVEGQQAAPHL